MTRVWLMVKGWPRRSSVTGLQSSILPACLEVGCRLPLPNPHLHHHFFLFQSHIISYCRFLYFFQHVFSISSLDYLPRGGPQSARGPFMFSQARVTLIQCLSQLFTLEHYRITICHLLTGQPWHCRLAGSTYLSSIPALHSKQKDESTCPSSH